MFDDSIIITRGSRMAISTSNTRKMIAIRKNCSENGSRADDIGSNPHSNGEDFSRSAIVFFDKVDANVITKEDNAMINAAMADIELITYTIYYRPYDWKSYILIYYISLSSSSVDWNV